MPAESRPRQKSLPLARRTMTFVPSSDAAANRREISPPISVETMLPSSGRFNVRVVTSATRDTRIFSVIGVRRSFVKMAEGEGFGRCRACKLYRRQSKFPSSNAKRDSNLIDPAMQKPSNPQIGCGGQPSPLPASSMRRGEWRKKCRRQFARQRKCLMNAMGPTAKVPAGTSPQTAPGISGRNSTRAGLPTTAHLH